jgi:peroxiredoxin
MAAPTFAQRAQPGALRRGDPATDFSLQPPGGGTAVALSSFRGRSPVALVFGSYT